MSLRLAKPSPLARAGVPPGLPLPTAPLRVPAGKWSIVVRLTMWYTLSACLLLFGATSLMYWLLSSSLREENNRFFVDEIETLRLILRQNPDEKNQLRELKEEVELEGAARRNGKYYSRILSDSGRVVLETTGMSNMFPATAFPPTVDTDRPVEKGQPWRTKRGQTFLLGAARGQQASAGHSGRVVQFALEVTNAEALLGKYRERLALVLLLGLVGSAAAGALIARKELRPLEEITQAAQRITVEQLNERIRPDAWPRELTRLATSFDEMLSRLEASFNRLSQFSADLAHELRTPINNLMGEAEVALSRTRTDSEYRHALESNLEECGRLSRMIDSLLFLARAENAETKIQRTTFEAQTEIQAVLDFYEALADEQGVALHRQGSVKLDADLILFRRAVSNLLANALHYTPRGGKITITAQLMDNQMAAISVADNGSGIAPEHLPRIFDRFYRADPSRAHHAQGTGLGLSIVKSIMELHSGSVEVQSEVEGGTVFTLWFPARANETQA